VIKKKKSSQYLENKEVTNQRVIEECTERIKTAGKCYQLVGDI
jgi:hypothetical protein